jgi:hypothetical protein
MIVGRHVHEDYHLPYDYYYGSSIVEDFTGPIWGDRHDGTQSQITVLDTATAAAHTNAASTAANYLVMGAQYWVDTAGSLTRADNIIDGILELRANSTTATEGSHLQFPAYEMVPTSGKEIVYETRVKWTGIANLNVETFVGLAEPGKGIIASSAIDATTRDLIGIGGTADDGVMTAMSQNASARKTGKTFTITSGQWYRIVIRFLSNTEVRIYVDDKLMLIADATYFDADDEHVPSFVCLSGGTDSPILSIDGFKITKVH